MNFTPAMKQLKIVTLSKRWKHHSKSGGYDQLIQTINSTDIYPAQKTKHVFHADFRRKMLRKLMPSVQHLNGYQLKDLSAELRSMIAVKREQADLLHALYGEDQLNLLLRFRNRIDCALVASYHLPAESTYMKRASVTGSLDRLSGLDAAIVMSNSMVEDYEQWTGKGKVFFVPHGIDTNTFKPAESKLKTDKKTFMVLTVGGHGRDWETIKEAAKTFYDRADHIKFHIVAPYKIKQLFEDTPNVQVYSAIPEEQLIELYRESDVVLLPVHYATANNSLLEALACGVPVISTRTGGIPDYLDNTSGWLLPAGDKHEVIELIGSLHDNRLLLAEKKIGARRKALNFDWEKVSEQMYDVYRFAINHFDKVKR